MQLFKANELLCIKAFESQTILGKRKATESLTVQETPTKKQKIDDNLPGLNPEGNVQIINTVQVPAVPQPPQQKEEAAPSRVGEKTKVMQQQQIT